MGIETRKSFTLIEIIVAVGVIGLILPAIFSIFFTIIRQQLVLVSYQEIKQQGDSAQRNIKNILQNRAAYITDSTYAAMDVCPLPLTPTPTFSPDLYMNDREGKAIHIFKKTVSGIDTIASNSGNINHNLTSKDVTVSGIGFSCYRINEFTPAIVSTKFTVLKSTMFKEVSLPYIFNTRLRNY